MLHVTELDKEHTLQSSRVMYVSEISIAKKLLCVSRLRFSRTLFSFKVFVGKSMPIRRGNQSAHGIDALPTLPSTGPHLRLMAG